MIKFLVEDGRFTYGLTGSLLGVELKDLRSEPVGFMDIVDVHPLDFEEFALAAGVSPDIFMHLSDCFEKKVPVDPVVHERMMSVFRLYMVVGGMPAAVWKYITTNNLQVVADEHRAVLRLYKRDISQYDPDRKLYLDEIFALIPSELNAKNKRFILKILNQNAKYQRYENGFLWLKNAGVAIPVFNVEKPKSPLQLNQHRNLFKLFQNDVGLLVTQYSNGIQLKILAGDTTLNYGAIYESVVAQELLAHGFENLCYFNSKTQGEVDFIIENGDGSVLPVELKSGKDYEFHNALTNILSNDEYSIPSAVVLCNDNVHTKGKRLYLPVYMATFLRLKDDVPGIYKLDLGPLA